ncbi:MAG: YHS domain protein [Planctomycetes bacterium]|nr:YHS domain protein [Planctomycetota bacterium]
MKLPLLAALVALASACAASKPAPAVAETALTPATQEYLLDPGRLAVLGYDVVSYFPEGGSKPVPGKPALRAELDGVVYYFATPEHRALFVADPGRFRPTYGGWCAHAMADGGRKVIINPENYLLTRGRLLLFYKTFWADAIPNWNKDPAQYELDADAWWQKIASETPRKPLG